MQKLKLTSLCLAFNLVFGVVLAAAQPQNAPTEYYGRIDEKLEPQTDLLYQTIFKETNADGIKVLSEAEKKLKVFAGSVPDRRGDSSKTISLLLVENPSGASYFLADINANDVIDPGERIGLRAAGNGSADLGGFLDLPIKHSFFKTFPVVLVTGKRFARPDTKATERIVLFSFYAHATGVVKIGERSVKMQYPFDSTNPGISTTEGRFGIDINADDNIDIERFSPEVSYSSGDELVFRYDNIFLSTSKIDLVKNQVVVRQREAKDYVRIELAIGREMPDFAFVDFNDKPRKLSEYRGKYLLIDIWGVWCVDCRYETPFQVEAYRRFKDRKFEILGLDSDPPEKLAMVREYLAENKMAWTQAKFESVKDLIEKNYRIHEYPSAILLDPSGKVLILDHKSLSGPQLLKTLDAVLPR